MSSLFDTYEKDYNSISAAISKKINSDIPSLRGEQKKAAIRATMRELEEAIEILDQMEVEAHTLPPSTRTRLQSRLRAYRSDVDQLSKEMKKASAAGFQDVEREQLLSGPTADAMAEDYEIARMDQRSRLLQGTQTLASSSKKLEDAHRVAIETEEIGTSILSDLRRQREQIEHTRTTLRDADTFIDKSQRLLKGMARRMATNRIVTFSIILVLVALIILILWIKLG